MPGKDVGATDSFAASDGREVNVEDLEDSWTGAKEKVEAGRERVRQLGSNCCSRRSAAHLMKSALKCR